jgi:hypothetical protein
MGRKDYHSSGVDVETVSGSINPLVHQGPCLPLKPKRIDDHEPGENGGLPGQSAGAEVGEGMVDPLRCDDVVGSLASPIEPHTIIDWPIPTKPIRNRTF